MIKLFTWSLFFGWVKVPHILQTIQPHESLSKVVRLLKMLTIVYGLPFESFLLRNLFVLIGDQFVQSLSHQVHSTLARININTGIGIQRHAIFIIFVASSYSPSCVVLNGCLIFYIGLEQCPFDVVGLAVNQILPLVNSVQFFLKHKLHNISLLN